MPESVGYPASARRGDNRLFFFRASKLQRVGVDPVLSCIIPLVFKIDSSMLHGITTAMCHRLAHLRQCRPWNRWNKRPHLL